MDQRNKKMAERHIAKFKKAMAVGNEEVESGSDGYEQESVPGIFQDWLPVCRPLPQSLMAHEEELFFVVP